MNSDLRAAIDHLTATASALAHLVAEVPEARLDWSENGGGWSPRTILAHLRDDEYLCMRVGLERMLAEERPVIRSLEGLAWEPTRNRTRDRREFLLADFALQRQASLGILRSLRDEDWQRTGFSSEEFTVAQFVIRWAGHDAQHIQQLEEALGETLGEALARRARPGAD
jgi:hypothetical protein